MGNAGRVLMIPKGDYNAATTYERLDFVYYQGRSYVCKQTSTGNVPTNTTYWQALTGDASAEIQALTNEVRGNWATGGVNKLPNTGTTDTKNGVTATYASDGKVTLNASSASTNISDFPISSTSKPFYLKEGTYVLSGGASADARLYIRTVASSSAIAIDSGNGAEFTVTSEMASGGFAVYLNVASGKTFNDVVISPMVADADYSGGYVPYAKTNVELTDAVTPKKYSITFESGFSSDNGDIRVINGICYFNPNIYASADLTVGTEVTVGVLPEGCSPIVAQVISCFSYSSGILIGLLKISRDRTITYLPSVSGTRFFGYVSAAFPVQ